MAPGKEEIQVPHFFVKKDPPSHLSTCSGPQTMHGAKARVKDKRSHPILGSSSLVAICDQVSTLTKWLCRKSIAAGVSLMHRVVRYSFPAAMI